jgi:hypothetical protein
MKHESNRPSLTQDSLTELTVICAIACEVGEAAHHPATPSHPDLTKLVKKKKVENLD